MHAKLTLGGAVLAASLVFTAPALADAPPVRADTPTPTTLSFDNVVLDTPGTGDQPLVSSSTQPLTVTAEVDPATGDFSVAPGDFSAPTYASSEGSATVTLKDPATGTIDESTGALTLTADFLATVTVGSFGSCTIDTGSQTLSTATTAPIAGHAFPAGPTGFSTGDGAFGVGWSTLAPGTGSACAFVDPEVDGPGGIWISRGISPTAAPAAAPAPKLSAKVAKPTAVKAGRTATVNVIVANTGGADPKPVKACLAAKKPLAPTAQCVTFKPGANTTRKIAFRVRTTAKTTLGTHLLTVSATGLKHQTVALKVKA